MTGRLLRVVALGLVAVSVQACTSSATPLSTTDRRQTDTTLAAAMTALSHAVRAGRAPLVVTPRTLERMGVDLPTGVSVGAFERIGRGVHATYKLCLLHAHGYWAASSYPVARRTSGRGVECGIAVGQTASPVAG